MSDAYLTSVRSHGVELVSKEFRKFFKLIFGVAKNTFLVFWNVQFSAKKTGLKPRNKKLKFRCLKVCLSMGQFGSISKKKLLTIFAHIRIETDKSRFS